ncbi:DUF4255 domain-containing protein [Vannielia litorea]|uniref:DUF4255 domain-containing protein n=1 Tax=Vannielia litorea TaxID=1217970 RepID=UPI001BCE634F|nr:DUF4255 domain-containing protein [Vannielia litorea]MBS8227944.1 DUF4255 domain-containing protein [Vannielia litorea]
MIYDALEFLRGTLNRALVQRFPTAQDWVLLSALTQADGTPPPGLKSRLCLSLINIERDPTASGTAPRVQPDEGQMISRAPLLALNLDVLVSAHFEDAYGDGLKLLSGAIDHFQGKPHYRAGADPGLPAGMTKLSVEWVDLNLQEIFNIWTVLGGHYVPSALYKVRMLLVADDRAERAGAPITRLGLEPRP